MSWTEERIERLKTMWHDGATASEIAEKLGGVSRNAVIGKAHRLGLEARPSPVKPGEEHAAPAKPAKAEAAPPPKAAPAPAPAKAGAAPQPQPQRQRPQAEAPAASSARAPATSRRRSRRPRRAGWSRPSRAPRLPTRPACSN